MRPCWPRRETPICPWSVPDSHATLRRSRTRFDSWRGHPSGPSVRAGSCFRLPVSVSGARRSSKPQGRVRFPGGGFSTKTSSECDGIARDPAKVVDQVQFLAGTWIMRKRRWSQTARRPAATRLKWVRLPPASSGIASSCTGGKALCPALPCRHGRECRAGSRRIEAARTTELIDPHQVIEDPLCDTLGIEAITSEALEIRKSDHR